MNFSKLISPLLLLVFSLSFMACRKGENDPLLSLKTRNARLTGIWELKSSEERFGFTDYFDGVLIESSVTRTLTDGLLTQKSVDNYTQNTVTDVFEYDKILGTFSSDLSITKEGKFTSTLTFNNEVTENVDSWVWLNTGKKKTAILMNGITYEVDRLTDKELTLIVSNSVNESALDNSEINGSDYLLIQRFEKK